MLNPVKEQLAPQTFGIDEYGQLVKKKNEDPNINNTRNALDDELSFPQNFKLWLLMYNERSALSSLSGVLEAPGLFQRGTDA